MAGEILGLIGLGAFSMFFIGLMAISFIEFIGRIYGTFRCLVREDLSGEQRIIYLGLIWFIPFGWLIYFLLGTEKSSDLFSGVEFL